mmetsp:Transcript_2084/g.4831  ORF Transcript_2084/g.4831 Transcript_2084/m.4831 type:complete len:102 (-) Transcript_2084:264-569(-)
MTWYNTTIFFLVIDRRGDELVWFGLCCSVAECFVLFYELLCSLEAALSTCEKKTTQQKKSALLFVVQNKQPLLLKLSTETSSASVPVCFHDEDSAGMRCVP